MPSRNLVKYLIPFSLWQPDNVFAVGLINSKILVMKILRLNFEMRNIICIPCRVLSVYCRNYIKKIFGDWSFNIL